GHAPGGDAPSERRERREMQANATIIFGLQILLSLLTYTIIARAYLWPRLAGLPLTVALPPLLLFNTFRTLGLVFLLARVVGATLPASFAGPGALGDFAAVVLAFLALGALRWGGTGREGGARAAGWAIALVWLFNLEGTADILNDYFEGARLNLAANY